MHIPDGYLSPIFALGTGVATVPAWALASNKVRAVLNHRTVPLLAVFAAFTFTIMMFNIPVPAGTTAHGVGGTLAAIVLGPWAAVLTVSVALIIQALFFGDGGILAILPNCLNMGVILPFVGYYSYRLIAGKSPLLSMRRVWAAGIGSYLGLTAASLAVGIELGLQPLLFSSGGQPLYNPYPMDIAVGAMLLTHLPAASLVEALLTAFGFVYIQQHHPEFLTSLRKIVAGADIEEGQAQKVPLWQIILAGSVGMLIILFVTGLATGNWNVATLYGVDWSQVNWVDVGIMLLIVIGIAIVLVPLAWFLLPRSIRGVGTGFIAASIFAPLGLITPGFAFGEGGPEDVQAAFGYIPEGLQQWSSIFSAPLAEYNIPLPFFSDVEAPLWRAAIGYEISGIVGLLLLGAVMLGIGYLLRRWQRSGTPVDEGETVEKPA